jgi:hypothetical protein
MTLIRCSCEELAENEDKLAAPHALRLRSLFGLARERYRLASIHHF